ncbi:MAG: hypothetical protein ACTSVK_08395 [Promethearchaeota archaeon]
MKIQQEILEQIEEVKKILLDPKVNFNELRVKKLIIKFKEDLKQCQKIDNEIMEFFNKKSNFRVRDDLIKFAKQNFNYNLPLKNRNSMNEEIARIAIQNKYNLDKLSKLIKKDAVELKSKRTVYYSSQKKKMGTKSQSLVKVVDQTLHWITLPIEDVRRELEDFSKYPDSKSLKQASSSILSTNEKRLRKREKIINVIIDHLEETKALAKFGG